MTTRVDLTRYSRAIASRSLFRSIGLVDEVVGLIVESRGPRVGLGSLCEVRPTRTADPILAEVVGFRGERVQLMAYGNIAGISQGAEVVATRRSLLVPVGDTLLGRVVDAFGEPIDGRSPLEPTSRRSVQATPPRPLERRRITEALGTGVRAIDVFTTTGRGQRLGIFSGSGVGKSTLMGMIARNATADVNVIALIGERGREVREFLERDLGPEGLARSVVVVATSDEPALVRVKAALTAMTIAEHFRDQARDVLMLNDSVTRIAMALREIGLAVGEPPTSRGYTPSVFAFLAPYLERAGTGSRGSITGIFTVLVEADDVNDPIGDAARGILDGHIVLSRALADRGHYPAIDVLASVSRVMPVIVDGAHASAAGALRTLLATHAHFEDLVAVGAYRRGQNPELDRTLEFMPEIRALQRQSVEDPTALDDARASAVALAERIAAWRAPSEATHA